MGSLVPSWKWTQRHKHTVQATSGLLSLGHMSLHSRPGPLSLLDTAMQRGHTEAFLRSQSCRLEGQGGRRRRGLYPAIRPPPCEEPRGLERGPAGGVSDRTQDLAGGLLGTL